MRRLPAIVLVLAIAVGTTSAQTATGSAVEAAAKRGIDEVYNLEFEKADSVFARLVAERPNDPTGYFLQAMVIWWRIVLDMDSEQYDREFYDRLDRVVDMCDSILDKDANNVDAIFFKGGAIGFKGRLKFHRDDYLAAANAGRKALPLVQEAQSLAPHNYDVLLGSGMYNYYADVIPQEYPFLKPVLLFIPPGDKKKGLEQLRLASQKGRYAATESAYFLMQVYFYYEKDYARALEIALDLHSRYPNNMLFHKYVGRGYVMMNNWAQAQRAFQDIMKKVGQGLRGYNATTEREAEYYLGQYDLMQKHLDESLRHFYRCDELSRSLDRNGPSGFMVMANLKIGNVYDLQQRRDLAISEYEKVASWKDYKGSVALADQYRKSPYTQ